MCQASHPIGHLTGARFARDGRRKEGSDCCLMGMQVLFNVNRKEKLELLEGLQLRKPDAPPLPKITQVVLSFHSFDLCCVFNIGRDHCLGCGCLLEWCAGSSFDMGRAWSSIWRQLCTPTERVSSILRSTFSIRYTTHSVELFSMISVLLDCLFWQMDWRQCWSGNLERRCACAPSWSTPRLQQEGAGVFDKATKGEHLIQLIDRHQASWRILTATQQFSMSYLLLQFCFNHIPAFNQISRHIWEEALKSCSRNHD